MLAGEWLAGEWLAGDALLAGDWLAGEWMAGDSLLAGDWSAELELARFPKLWWLVPVSVRSTTPAPAAPDERRGPSSGVRTAPPAVWPRGGAPPAVCWCPLSGEAAPGLEVVAEEVAEEGAAACARKVTAGWDPTC